MTEDPRGEAWQRMRGLTHLPEHLDEVHRVFAEAGLTPGVGKALVHLDRERPLPMSGLAGALRCDNSYATAVVDALESRQLVERRVRPGDRRVKAVVLTPAGARLARRVRAALDRPPAVLGRLSDEDASLLVDLLRRLDDPDAHPSERS